MSAKSTFTHIASFLAGAVVLTLLLMWLLKPKEQASTPKPAPSASSSAAQPVSSAPQPSASAARAPRWEPATSLQEIEGPWIGPGESWVRITAREHLDWDSKKSIYPWYLRYRPSDEQMERDGFQRPLECGMYEKLHVKTNEPSTRPFRTGFCWDGDQKGDDAYAERFILMLDRNSATLDVSIGAHGGQFRAHNQRLE